MEKRKYGKMGDEISIIGFGGIINKDESQQDANDYVSEAIDAGVNYFDVAPSYGNAEDRLGPALAGRRKQIFLACKTEKRTAEDAEKALYESLKKLKTDYFDLYQFHAVTTIEEVRTILGPGGAMEVFAKAKEKGIIRHLGFSAHAEEPAIALMEACQFDSVLFPINWAHLFNNGFGKRIMDKAIEKDVYRLSLKAMARTKWEKDAQKTFPKAWYEPIQEKELARLAMRYTLSQPISAAIPPGDITHFRWALEVGNNFKPVTEDEVEFLRKQSRGLQPIFE